MFAGDRDRERAAAALRQHYVGGRLTLDELSTRLGRVFAARSREELRTVLAGLPIFPDARDVASQARAAAQTVFRGALLVALTAAYVMFCFALLLVFAVTLLVHGASLSLLAGFLVVWLVPTYLLSRQLRAKRSPRSVSSGVSAR